MKFNTMKMEDALDALIDYRGKTPKKSKTGIMTLSAKSVKNNHIDYSQCYFISEEEYEKFMVRGFPKKGDILLTTEAPLGLVARLDRNDVAIAQRLLTLRGKENVLDNDYLLYYLQSPIGQASLKVNMLLLRMVRVAYSGIHKEVVSHFLWYFMHICCKKHWIVQL